MDQEEQNEQQLLANKGILNQLHASQNRSSI